MILCCLCPADMFDGMTGIDGADGAEGKRGLTLGLIIVLFFQNHLVQIKA